MEKWLLKKRNFFPKEIAQSFSLSKPIAEILSRRDLQDLNKVSQYLNKDKALFHNPFLMKDMEKATEIIIQNIEEKKKILLVLDYDVDGIISGAVSYLGFKNLGAFTECLFPHRVTDGYGINKKIVQYAAENNFSLIVTFDNGIAAFEAVNYANENDIKIVVTDHHEVPKEIVSGNEIDKIVSADAVVNPNQKGCNYPFSKICGAMVAYKLVHALHKQMKIETKYLKNIFPIVSIATICDVMDLEDENRYSVYYGLKNIRKIDNIGLKVLFDALSIPENVSVYDIGFKIGPCFNSAGRLGTAKTAFDLLVCDDFYTAENISKELIELNNTRKKMTAEGNKLAVEYIEEQNLLKNKILILNMKDMHESLCGIVAGKIKEKYDLPTIIFSESEGLYKGSARSTDNINIFYELSKYRDLMLKFGGHSAAAGVSLEKEKFGEFQEKIVEHFNNLEIYGIKEYRIDAILNLPELNINFAKNLEIFEPTGKGNPPLLFATKNLYLNKFDFLGKEKNVLRLEFMDGFVSKSFITFDFVEILNKIKSKLNIADIEEFYNPNLRKSSKEVLFDVLYRIKVNLYNDNEYLDLELVSIR